MKYIIFEDFAGEPTPVMFPERISFMEMREQIPYTKVISAGTIKIVNGNITCSGRSSELGVAASNQDSAVIAGYLE